MITIAQFQEILADALFSGDMEIAGLTMYAIILGIIFSLCKGNWQTGMIITLPVTLIFSILAVLSSEATMLIIVIVVLCIAISVKESPLGG